MSDFGIIETTKKFLENLIDAVREPLVVLDQYFRVISVSQPFYEVFHTKSEETIGRLIYDVGNRQWDIPRLKELLETILVRSTTFQDYEVVHDFSSIGRRTMLLNARQIKVSSGMDKIILLAIEDITDRKRMEEEIQKNQRAESLGVLAGGIAHDFSNLMAGLMANIEVAIVHLKAGRAENALERLEKTPSIFTRGQALTRRLLTFVKGGAPVRVLTALGPLIEEWVDFAFIGSDIRTGVEIDPDLWTCDCDVNQIGQVVNNLLINARQASADGSCVTVKVTNVLEGNPLISIEIIDQGIGIPPEAVDKIFDPYFTTKPKGAGLGLAVAFSIIRQHNGSIKVRTHTGEGTAFQILLPALPRQTTMTKLARLNEEFVNSGLALVMDDNDALRDAVAELLITMGYEVIQTKSGQETLRLWRELQLKGSKIDVFLLDNQIPGGLGGQATAEKLVGFGCTAQIILMSGYFEPIPCSSRGEGGFWRLAKPFAKNDLVHILGPLSLH
jgi:PAS domain S-box-containing protein